jgi:hypothetical protein
MNIPGGLCRIVQNSCGEEWAGNAEKALHPACFARFASWQRIWAGSLLFRAHFRKSKRRKGHASGVCARGQKISVKSSERHGRQYFWEGGRGMGEMRIWRVGAGNGRTGTVPHLSLHVHIVAALVREVAACANMHYPCIRAASQLMWRGFGWFANGRHV